MIITLDKVKEGQKCVISKINLTDPFKKRRFLELGLTKGTVVTVFKKQHYKNGLIIIKYFNTKLAILKKDLAQIEVEVLEQKNENIIEKV